MTKEGKICGKKTQYMRVQCEKEGQISAGEAVKEKAKQRPARDKKVGKK